MSLIRFSLTLIITIFSLNAVWAQQDAINQKDGIAIQRYDPVAYFTDGEAARGSDAYTVKHKAVTYYFKNLEHMHLFQENPEKYLPEYGGWCAYAMADGEKVKVDPETFRIIDGRLYLFYNFYFNNTLTKWNLDETALKKKADLAWEQLTK